MKRAIVISAFSGLQFGYNTTVIAGALLLLTNAFSLSPLQQGIIASMTLFGALCTSLFAGTLADRMGRKNSIGLSVLLFTVGCALSAWATSYEQLLVGRLLIGFGAGIATIVAPLYIIEIAPAELRGAANNLYQMGIALGALFAYLSNYFLAEEELWRLMFGLGMLPGVIQGFGLFFIPESGVRRETRATWSALFEPTYRRRLLLGGALIGVQSLSGSNAVLYFAPKLLQSTGAHGVLFATLCLGVIYAVSTLISASIIDRWGRRFLLFCSLFGMLASLLAVVFASLFHAPFLDKITPFSLSLYIGAYAIGLGPVPQLVIGEISPPDVRAAALGITGFLGWVTNYLVVLTVAPMLHLLTLGGTFCLYSLFCLLGVIVVWSYLPETKQKSLEEIDRLFNGGRPTQ